MFLDPTTAADVSFAPCATPGTAPSVGYPVVSGRIKATPERLTTEPRARAYPNQIPDCHDFMQDLLRIRELYFTGVRAMHRRHTVSSIIHYSLGVALSSTELIANPKEPVSG